MHQAVRRLALSGAVATCALAGVAGPGTSAAGAATSTAKQRSVVEKVMLDRAVAADADQDYMFQTGFPLAQRHSAARDLVRRMNASITAIEKVKASGKVENDVAAYVAQTRLFVVSVRKVAAAGTAGYATALKGTVKPYNRSVDAEHALRRSVGLPATDPWFTGRARGATVYTDTLAQENAPVSAWAQQPPVVTYANGGLTVAPPVDKDESAQPYSPRKYDHNHSSVQVTAHVVSGDPLYGVMCPGTLDSDLIAVLGPGGKWDMGTVHDALVGGKSRFVTSGVNTIRLDCDRYSSAFSTSRLYVNGHFIAEDSAPLQFSAKYPEGLIVMGGSTATSAVFSNWSIARQP